jgi:protoporphyrinogen oxidase
MTDTIVIGGGLAGMVAAWRMARQGQRVMLLEKNDYLGGLASSFERDGRLYPLGYHHILSSDSHLLAHLARLGLLDRVHWKRLDMGFSMDGHIHSLGRPKDWLTFPLPWVTKARMAARVVSAWIPKNRTDEPASQWLARIAGESAVQDFFDPLTHIKFGLPCSGLSAAWLRARLQAGESGGQYGYMPNDDWVSVLIETLHERLLDTGVTIRLQTGAERLRMNDRKSRITAVITDAGEVIPTRAVVGALAPPLLERLTGDVSDPQLSSIQYTGVVSTVMATRQDIPLDRYWTNFLRPNMSFGGIFRLDLLNDSLGHPGMKLLNFCTHVRDRGDRSMLRWEPEEIEQTYRTDFERCFSIQLDPEWSHTSRVPYYSPVFVDGYTNPPVTHCQLRNLFLAGNHRTFPVLATTGSAMGSGMEAAEAAIQLLAKTPRAVEDTEAA